MTEMRPDDFIEGNGWTAKAVGVAHFGPQLVSCGFRLDSPEGSFVYSGDSGPCASMEKLSQREADVQLIWLSFCQEGEPFSPWSDELRTCLLPDRERAAAWSDCDG